MKKRKRREVLLIACILLATLAACSHGNDYVPKPRTYLRFDFAPKQYTLCDTLPLPFTFERATESQMVLKKQARNMVWVDLTYPQYKGIVFLSYLPLHGVENLAKQVDTSYRLLKMHFDRSSGVEERQYVDEDNRVFATTYLLKGASVASTYQFWATDSSDHFLRGSLYLDCPPSNDSLAPILDYLRQDLVHLLETLRWRTTHP